MRGFAEMADTMCGEAIGRRRRSSWEDFDFGGADGPVDCRCAELQPVGAAGVAAGGCGCGALLRGCWTRIRNCSRTKARIRVEGRLPVVLANEAGLTQCFSNLLGNAVKFVKRGENGPEIRVWADHRDGWVRIWVEDKGIGIAKEMLPRVFDMFARGSKDYEGTGIGLALVRKVTQRMGGGGGGIGRGKGSRFLD
jgi:signal transduction histidine kinase